MLVLDPVKIYSYVGDNTDEGLRPCDNTEDVTQCLRALGLTYNHNEREPIFGFRNHPNTASAYIYRALHSLSHLFIRVLGKVSGVDESSIAEMIFPTRCSVLLYVNQCGEFNLGTFSTCFESYLEEICERVNDRAEDCLYDPICTIDADSSCPACLQLGEVSCENFNRDLSRKYLIGGENVRGLWQ